MSVDLTIYKTGNNVDAANRASINIKNNNEKTQKTGFDGVIVSEIGRASCRERV